MVLMFFVKGFCHGTLVCFLDVVLFGSVACVDLRALESCILEVIIWFEDSRYGGLR